MQDIQTLLDRFLNGPRQLTAMVADLNDGELDAVPIPGKWSIREVVCHIADFEIVSADRVRRVLAENNPMLLDGDQDQFAKALQYGRRTIEPELSLIDAIRRSTVNVLAACDIEVFQRTGVHSIEGPMTLETLVERTANHISHHLPFIEEKIAAMRF